MKQTKKEQARRFIWEPEDIQIKATAQGWTAPKVVKSK